MPGRISSSWFIGDTLCVSLVKNMVVCGKRGKERILISILEENFPKWKRQKAERQLSAYNTNAYDAAYIEYVEGNLLDYLSHIHSSFLLLCVISYFYKT